MLRNLKLSTKLWSLTVLLLAAVLLVVLNSVWSTRMLLAGSHKATAAADYNIFIAKKEVDHLKWVNRVKDLFVDNQDHTDVEVDYTKCSLGKFIYGEEARRLIEGNPAFADLLESIKQPHIHLHESVRLINSTVQEKGHEAALEIFKQKTLPALAETQSNMKTLADKLNDIQETSKNEMAATETTLRWSAILITAAAFLLGGFLSFFIIRSITKPIGRIIGGLNESSEQVSSAAGQISASSHSLAQGSSEQAAAIEETSSSLEEMSSMTRQNAGNAGQADQLMKEANQVVGKANQSMTELTASMSEISKASEETSKIIKTIDEIAFQTNLLALNAAVEAARAGEAGAGFAVVADEVRNLAMRAAEAAKNTATMIEGTVKKINDGSELVARTNEDFNHVAESSSKVGELVAEIAAASNEQAHGIEQVNSAVSEMDKVTQQNAATAEESASAAEQMSAQSKHMRSMVHELTALAGGVSKGDRRGATRPVQVALPATRKQLTAPPNTIGKSPVRPAGKRSPEEIIPFEDDFADF